MTDALIAQIQTFTLAGRAALETEVGQQLEGIYGWLPDGAFGAPAGYPALAQLDEAGETRRRLEQFVADEQAVGVAPKEARRKLVRETAFTWLNRLAAFRLMEERRLLKQTIVRLTQSNGFIFWVTDENAPERQQAYVLYQQGPQPVNPMGEGPRDIAYRRFLLWQCGELARDVSILFDPGTIASRLCPRPAVLKQLVDAMNAENLVEAWQAGNEEVLGWTYEGFIEEENGEVFERFSKGKKVLPEEIGAATQRFTPRWIVRFLVENSLGRIWLEMHPDSRLAQSLGYYVPVEKTSTRAVRPVREIDFLDPSCGSMHFGLVAFDLFVEMYREELERAGQPGWPAKASVAKAEDIPGAIVQQNLFGIDLDLRAVQIAALTMFIKARTLQPGCAVTDLNFACANMEQISGGRLDSIVSQAKFKHPIYESVLRGLVSRMKNSDQLGSLLRPEKVLQELIATERRKAEENLLLLPGLVPGQFKTAAGMEEFFSNLSEQILQQLDGMVQASRAAGQDPGHLVAEASKGLRFLRLVSRHYDVVATNPPYMSRRNMSAIMAAHLDEQFKEGKGDLYAAFIARCAELADLGGTVAMVTQQSFMFISSYEDLRAKLRDGSAIETMAHLGPRAFPNIAGEKVNTTAFVVEKRASKTDCDAQEGVYFRLVREPDADSKRRAFEAALAAHSQAQPHPLLFRYRQQHFDAIPDKPWVYWMPADIRALFVKCEILARRAKPRQGLATADNTRFLRYWWEVGSKLIGFGFKDRQSAVASEKKWFPYNKGGAAVPWQRRQDNVVDWERDGAAIRCFGEEDGYIRSRPQNTDYYFKRGVTWSDISTKGFAARLAPSGFIHDVKGMTCFPSDADVLSVLGLLNSKLARFIIAALNPTVSFQVGDIERLPVPNGHSPRIDELVGRCVELTETDSREAEVTYGFIRPLRRFGDRGERKVQLATLENEVDAEVSRLYGLTEADLAAIERELSGPAVDEDSDVGEADGSSGDDDAEGNDDFTPADWARSWLSYALGTVLGRFEIGKPGGLGCGDFPPATVTAIRALIDADGIMPCDAGHKQDLAARAVQCLSLMLGEAEARDVIRTATGETGDPVEAVRGWLDRFTGNPDTSFWKYHFQLYRKRPVYWPLQSPRKKYTVWVFQERFSKDTLFKVRSEFVEPKARWLDARIKELKAKSLSSDTRERRGAEKEASRLADTLDDMQEFAQHLNRIVQRGYTPHIDDGVLLNAAPLWELLPSWPDTKKAWQELEAGDYDWAQQAMEYWPDRVRRACQTNKSFAIAHGLA